MNRSRDLITQLAYSSNLEKFADLLREHGQQHFYHYDSTGEEKNDGPCLDAIKDGVSWAPVDIRDKKNGIIHDYLMGEGEFAKEKKDVPTITAQDLRDAVEELTRVVKSQESGLRETRAELGAVREELAELRQKRLANARVQAL